MNISFWNCLTWHQVTKAYGGHSNKAEVQGVGIRPAFYLPKHDGRQKYEQDHPNYL